MCAKANEAIVEIVAMLMAKNKPHKKNKVDERNEMERKECKKMKISQKSQVEYYLKYIIIHTRACQMYLWRIFLYG